ncbi:hypothetical protein HPG69_004172 [Diceros bicornis minor]|uniref:Uncharacterized protein n=1 Tax=Diceros bicornis minor TaxID=77932 RepID=A0A7J7EA17_DICBM|nr:hypothetical protein HPG69_004172 [Diceros bicornis minor]
MGKFLEIIADPALSAEGTPVIVVAPSEEPSVIIGPFNGKPVIDGDMIINLKPSTELELTSDLESTTDLESATDLESTTDLESATDLDFIRDAGLTTEAYLQNTQASEMSTAVESDILSFVKEASEATELNVQVPGE